jgi:RNA polymerase sigma factor (sigma-70 family)
VIVHNLRDKNLADDIYQDYFLSLVSRPIPGDVKNVKHYIRASIQKDIVDAVRRVQRYKNLVQRFSQYQENNSQHMPKPENGLIKDEEVNRIFSQIEKHLARCEAEAIVFRYKNEYKTKEVAQKMGVKHKTAQTYIRKGLQKMRSFITK